MAWITLVKPATGAATTRQLIADIIDDLTFLYNSFLGASTNGGIPNGSFENDSNSDGIPDGWVRTLFTGGSSTWDNTTSSHGLRSFKLTSPGGAGNGGGYLETENFIECSPNRDVKLFWQLLSTVAGVRNKVELRWYDKTQVFISSSTLYDSTINPTTWTQLANSATPPATARYFKIRLTGCDNSNTTAGSTSFDDIRLSDVLGAVPAGIQAFTASGTFVVPNGVTKIRVRAVGGGGGASERAGGGGSAYAESILTVTPQTSLTVTIGAGGSGGNTSGNNGGDTILKNGGTDLLRADGGGGATSQTQGGAGGVATLGDFKINGQPGHEAGLNSLGGVSGGFGGAAGRGGTAAAVASTPGLGGTAGRMVIEW